MSEKTKVVLNGQLFPATKVPIRTNEERWSEYMLDDGTVIRIKVVLTEASRIDNLYEPDGTPVYNVKTSPVIAVSAHEDLKRIPGEQS